MHGEEFLEGDWHLALEEVDAVPVGALFQAVQLGFQDVLVGVVQ